MKKSEPTDSRLFVASQVFNVVLGQRAFCAATDILSNEPTRQSSATGTHQRLNSPPEANSALHPRT